MSGSVSIFDLLAQYNLFSFILVSSSFLFYLSRVIRTLKPPLTPCDHMVSSQPFSVAADHIFAHKPSPTTLICSRVLSLRSAGLVLIFVFFLFQILSIFFKISCLCRWYCELQIILKFRILMSKPLALTPTST